MSNKMDNNDDFAKNQEILTDAEGNETITAEEDEGTIEDDDSQTKENEKYGWDIPPSREILEKCLKISFTETSKDDLISIIENKYSELAGTIGRDERIRSIIRISINYCTEHDDFDALWSGIKKERPKRYDEFFSDWEASYKKEQEVKSNEELATQHDKRIKDEQKNQTEDKDITKWFFDELDYVEQSMVITAALFQGIERNSFHEITQDIHKLLSPPEQEIPRSEPSSEENQEDSEQQKEKQVPPQCPRLKNELEQFRMANLTFISDKRNSDYGLTDVEIVIFEFNTYQTEILKLVKNNLYSKQSDLFEFIRSLVDNRSAEKRLFAVKAVIALSETHLFQDLLDRIIRTWAKTKNYYTHQATALALSGILLQERLENEILALLNSWLKTDTNRFLNITSIFTYYLIADKYPKQALQAVAYVSCKKNDIFQGLDIAFRVNRSQQPEFISYLCNWIKDERPILRQQASIYFFSFITLDDVVEDQESRKKIVEIISILWKSRTIPQRLKIQQETTEKIREWAEEALSTFERNEKETFVKYQTLFHELYRECGEKIDYYFNKWQEYREYKQRRAVERGASNESLLAARQVNFSLLIPTEE